MSRSMLLVHSPLVGPSTWSTLALAAAAAGFDVTVPDLTGAATGPPPQWQRFVDAAIQAGCGLDGPVAVVGHSAAGVTLPQIAAELGDRCAMTVYVDAIVPPTEGVYRASDQFVELLDEQTIDGLLNQWLNWWPDNVVASLLPDPEQRAALLADMPRLPRAFYDEAVPVPEDWSSRPNAYVQLSPAYDTDRRAASERGWPTASLDSTHLGMFTEPAVALDAIVGVLDR